MILIKNKTYTIKLKQLLLSLLVLLVNITAYANDSNIAAGWTTSVFGGGIVEAAPSPNIEFADANVKALCVANWDTNGDGELSEEEAAAVTVLGTVFRGNTTITSFNELQYFTSLTSISIEAFKGCSGLTSITIPNSVESIGEHAFGGCSSIAELILPPNVSHIGSYAFYKCSSMTSINIPSKILIIEEGTFRYCSNLKSLVIEDSSSYLLCHESYYYNSDHIYSCFSDCPLEAVYLGRDLLNHQSEQYVSRYLGFFYGKNNLSSLEIGDNVTSIKDYMFYIYNCVGLSSVSLPNSVTSIGKYAFSGCKDLTTIAIPEKVTYIGSCAFYYSGLTSVVVDIESPLPIDTHTFTTRDNATLYVPAGSKADYEAAPYWQDFNIVEFIEGDVNSDGETDVVDVVDIARFVVGTPAETFVPILADINNNGEVNVGDAVALVNEIAGDQNFVKPWRAPQQNSVAGDVLTLISTDNGMSLCMENERNYTAFQFDLFLPAGTDVTNLKLNAQRKQGHQLIYNKVEESHYRVAAISTSNRTFNGYEGELLAVGLEGIENEDICLRNIRFFTTDGEEHLFDDIVMQSGTTTDIASPQQPSNGDEAIYNLAGQRIQKMQKGINIVNGKKVMIK